MSLVNYFIVFSYIIPLGYFIACYAREPWTSTSIGISYMAQKIAILLIVLASVVGRVLPDFHALSLIRMVVYLAIAVLLWVDVANIMHIRRENRRK